MGIDHGIGPESNAEPPIFIIGREETLPSGYLIVVILIGRNR